MGVGLWLNGTYSVVDGDVDGGDFLDRVEAWIGAYSAEHLEYVRKGQDHEGRDGIFALLHPAAEELELLMPEVGKVIAAAKTSSVGPAYHACVCDLLKGLADDVGISWLPGNDEDGTGDETGYFHTGDYAAVEEEMLVWLRSMMEIVAENEGNLQMISMPLGHFYPDTHPLVTPLGPRTLNWRDAILADPRQGIDIFPWWSQGFGAGFFIGRALYRMWLEVRRRKPMLDREAKLLDLVHRDLSQAFQLDPCRSYPFREWNELLQYRRDSESMIDSGSQLIESEVERRAHRAEPSPLIGYRRHPVRAYLSGGWSIEIPGAMAEEWDEEGTWSAWDGSRTVWFTAWSKENEDGSEISAREILDQSSDPDDVDCEPIEFIAEQTRGRAFLLPYEEEGEELWNLKARVAADGAFCVCNIYFHDDEDREWAIATWKSIGHT